MRVLTVKFQRVIYSGPLHEMFSGNHPVLTSIIYQETVLSIYLYRLVSEVNSYSTENTHITVHNKKRIQLRKMWCVHFCLFISDWDWLVVKNYNKHQALFDQHVLMSFTSATLPYKRWPEQTHNSPSYSAAKVYGISNVLIFYKRLKKKNHNGPQTANRWC